MAKQNGGGYSSTKIESKYIKTNGQCRLCESELPIHDRTHNKKGAKYPGYCNLYCLEGERLKLTRINGAEITGSHHHSGMLYWPPISRNCDWCESEFILKYGGDHHSNQTFCSKPCYNAMQTQGKRKAYAKYLILHQLAMYPDEVFTAKQLSDIFVNYPTFSKCNNPNYVAGVLKIYIARGIVCSNKSLKTSNEPTVYWINGKNNTKPIGQWI